MPSAAEAFKVAEDAAVRGSAALVSAMGLGGKGILTEVPTNVTPPYVVMGEHQIIISQNPGCADEAEVFATIHWWSRPANPDKQAQARAMGAAIAAAVQLELTLTGWDVDDWQPQDERYSTDPDHSTHGILSTRYLLTQQT